MKSYGDQSILDEMKRLISGNNNDYYNNDYSNDNKGAVSSLLIYARKNEENRIEQER